MEVEEKNQLEHTRAVRRARLQAVVSGQLQAHTAQAGKTPCYHELGRLVEVPRQELGQGLCAMLPARDHEERPPLTCAEGLPKSNLEVICHSKSRLSKRAFHRGQESSFAATQFD